MDGFAFQDNANMKDCWSFDKNFNGLSDEILGDFIGFFDFPLEDVETDVVEQDWDAQFKHLEEPSLGVFSSASSSSGLCDRKTHHENPKLGRSFPASVSFLHPPVLHGLMSLSTSIFPPACCPSPAGRGKLRISHQFSYS